ncbi:MAG: hypothetical protein COT18_11560 [Elusimicrobia bacterium CG08_land_8_20_14_0_20_59_10]|nr:MAG: hypothetical protein COT18_11560 [Elusimicrobia bacterium CG08_land_8_20_14_0_20_59_10]
MTAAVLLFSSAAYAQPWRGFPFAISTAAVSGEVEHNWPLTIPLESSSSRKGSDFSKKTLKELTEEVEPEKNFSNFNTVVVYKGKSAVKKTYKLDLPKDAHWRILWKVAVTEKKKNTVFKMELRSPKDEKYLQGISKDMKPFEEGAFGVINVCLLTGGEFFLALDISDADWKVEAQQLK